MSRRALAWRDFMVSNYSDGRVQERWLADNHIGPESAGSGQGWAGPGVVEVGWAARYTAKDIIHRHRRGTRSSRRSRGCASSRAVWTNREATGMKAVPRRLLILGGGPVGVEMAQARAPASAARRYSSSARSGGVGAREPAPSWATRSARFLRPRTGSSSCSVSARRPCGRRRRGLRRGARGRPASCTATSCSWPPARAPRVPRHRPGDDRDRARPGTASRWTRTCAVADGVWAVRRRRRHLPADARRQVPGAKGSSPRTSSARRREAKLRGRAADHLYRPAGRPRWAPWRVRFSGDGAGLAEIAKTEDLHAARYADSLGYLTLLSDGSVLVGAHAPRPRRRVSGCSRRRWPSAARRAPGGAQAT